MKNRELRFWVLAIALLVVALWGVSIMNNYLNEWHYGKLIDHSFDVPRPHTVFNLDRDSSYFYIISLGKRNWDSSWVCTSDFINSAFIDSGFREIEK